MDKFVNGLLKVLGILVLVVLLLAGGLFFYNQARVAQAPVTQTGVYAGDPRNDAGTAGPVFDQPVEFVPAQLLGNGDLNWAYQAGPAGSAEFCAAMSQVVGGPQFKWHPTQNPDGSYVSKSCVLREADSRDPRGWPITIPVNVVAHVWLDKGGEKLAITAVGPGRIDGEWLAARATLYFESGVDFGHPGEWTFEVWSGDQTPTCSWSAIGQPIQPCDAFAGLGAGAGGPASCSVLREALGTQITSEGSGYLVVNLTTSYVVPEGVIAQWSDNPLNSTPSDGTLVLPPGAATLYCK